MSSKIVNLKIRSWSVLVIFEKVNTNEMYFLNEFTILINWKLLILINLINWLKIFFKLTSYYFMVLRDL